MNQVDFIFQSDVRRIFDHFTGAFDIRIVFFSYDGTELTSGDDLPRCRYCRTLREKLGYELTCKRLDRKQMVHAFQFKRLITYTCHGGMIEATLPVYTVDKLIGYIMIGQFRTSNRMPNKIRRQWNARFGNDEIYKIFLDAPFFPKHKVKNILGLFAVLVDFIVSHHLIRIKSVDSIQTIVGYIDAHPEANLTLTSAAEMLNCSVSSLTHAFKKATGRSFKNYVIDRKLLTAQDLLSSSNDLTISQIATRVGYDDPFLFSRIYKKHRGHAPSRYRSTLP
ncbi:MAG: hypothetical protein A2Y12_10365 [Planctomycetes bacterium GWF2_42_9]|nr:MAG: hypothetical protein A2Y12_10365 [Planctomycetes bacterium GWF2_42_9]